MCVKNSPGVRNADLRIMELVGFLLATVAADGRSNRCGCRQPTRESKVNAT